MTREEALEILKKYKDESEEDYWVKRAEALGIAIEALENQKIGHWVKHKTPNNTDYYDCSLCGCLAPCTEFADSYLWKLSKFCPDCSAKMEGV